MQIFFYPQLTHCFVDRIESIGARCLGSTGTNKMIDRSKIAQAVAKAIAYKCCGKETEAREWARELVRLLEVADILA